VIIGWGWNVDIHLIQRTFPPFGVDVALVVTNHQPIILTSNNGI